MRRWRDRTREKTGAACEGGKVAVERKVSWPWKATLTLLTPGAAVLAEPGTRQNEPTIWPVVSVTKIDGGRGLESRTPLTTTGSGGQGLLETPQPLSAAFRPARCSSR